MTHNIIDNILYKNFNASPQLKPFPHSTYTFFTPEICDKLADNIRNIKHILSNTTKLSLSRFKINLEGDTVNGIYKHKYLNEIRKIEPLNTIIKEYEKNIPNQLYKKYNNDKIPEKIKFCIMLVYDLENYEIGPHTDSYTRNATIVTFLGPKSDLKIGTRIYTDLIDRHKDKWEKTHYKFDNFEEFKMIDYYPGSSVDFKVSPNSYHGVPKINENCERISIQYFIYNN